MITLTNSQLNKTLEGVHGGYIKLSPSVGIKIIHSRIYKSRAKAFRSRTYYLANEEAEILKVAYDSGVVPRCYGPTVIAVPGGFKVGVLMQHLGSLTLSESVFYEDNEIYDNITERLGELGIKHFDLHEDNIMVYRGKFYAIDFSPESIELKD